MYARTPDPARDPARFARVLLVSCYELGQEPLGLIVPAGVIARAGYHARLLDLAVSAIDIEALANADVVAISTPMHTALRLGTQVAAIARRVNPAAHLCFFGLYAGLNRARLVPELADSCLGAEFESELLELVRRVGVRGDGTHPRDVAPQIAHADRERSLGRTLDLTPLRDGLSRQHDRYARLLNDGESHAAAAVASTRGCKHLCRHCPLPPAYDGSFYALPLANILDDVSTVVARGARHITFADADFLNGPTHALRVARAIAQRFPGLTFDYTAKIEHLQKHTEVVDELQVLGNLFVVSAVESFNDAVLAALRKDHTRADAIAVVRRLRTRGLALRPTFVPFTPWETRASYAELFEIVDGEGLVDHIDPVQYSIRLLVPEGSLLLHADEMRPHLGAFDAEGFSYRWTHPDASMDALQREVARAAAERAGASTEPGDAFDALRDLIETDEPNRARQSRTHRAGRVPRLTEDWFC